MKKSVVRSTLGLLALLVMLSSAAWAAGASEDYQADEDMQNTPYASLDDGASEDQLWDFAEAWRLAAAEGGVVTLQQDVLAAAEDAPEGIFVQVPEDGQVTLNLNGHRLAGEDVPCLIYVGVRGRLTVTDGGQSGGRIVGVIGVDDGADDPDEWGQVELLGDVEVVEPEVMLLAEDEAKYTPLGGTAQAGTFAAMWNKAVKDPYSTVTLLTDVTAENGSFGSGDGFGTAATSGYIVVPKDAKITLNLNGHQLSRGLTKATSRGYVIDVQQGGQLTIDDTSATKNGSITGGYSTNSAGGINVNGTLYVQSGMITGNHTQDDGGGIDVGTRGILYFGGGSICNNTAKAGGGISFSGGSSEASPDEVCIAGGTISGNHATSNGGGVYSRSSFASELIIAGTAQITGNTSGTSSSTSNVYLLDFKGMTLGTLSGPARIGVDSYYSNCVIAKDATDAVSPQYLFADNSGKHLVWTKTGTDNKTGTDIGTISLLNGPPPHEHALNVGLAGVTDGTATVQFDHKLTSDSSNQLYIDDTPASVATTQNGTGVSVSGYQLSAGSYVLGADLAINKPIIFDSTVSLCLNGHEIRQTETNEGVLFVPESSTVNICDCNSSNSMHTIQHDGSSVQIQGGLITGGNLLNQTASFTGHSDGGGIYNLGTLSLYRGTIAGNKAYGGGGISNILNGVLKMYGATVSYNTATGSGSIVHVGSNMILSDCTIESNTTHTGGGVYVNGNATISNCTIKYNKAVRGTRLGSADGGGLRVWSQGTGAITIENCTIEENYAEDNGGGIYYNGNLNTLTLINGRITQNTVGTADDANGAGVFADSRFTVKGSPVVWGNTKNGQQNNVYMYPDAHFIIDFNSDDLKNGTQIGITTKKTPTENADVLFAMPTPTSGTTIKESDVSRFCADDSSQYHIIYTIETYETAVLGPRLGLRLGGTVQHTHNGSTFTEFTAPSGSLSSGSYYLTGDITLTDTVAISGSGSVNLCLNGHTITGPTGKAAFKVPSGAILNIYNDEGTNGFAGLSGSGGIQVDGGGKLSMVPKTGEPVKYEPGAGSGGKVTVGSNGQVTTPGSGSGEGPTPGTGNHKTDHPDPDDSFTPINTGNFTSVTSNQTPAGYTGALPAQQSAYRFLDPGRYYLDGNFTMPYALIVVPGADGAATDFCLYGSNLGADNDTWLYEMQHVFWVPNQAVLNVLDCQRDLHIVWLYGGRVFLKNGARVNISGKVPDYITTIEMDNGTEGEVKIEYVDQEPVMTLPKGSTLTQKAPGKPDQIITNRDGVLEMTTSGAATKITPPSESTSINLKLPETVGEEAPAIVLEAPAGSTVQTADGPEIKLEQPGEVAADGTVSSPKVTVKTEEAETTVTAPSGGNVQVNADGEAQVPEGGTVTTGGETVKIEEIGGSAADAVTVLPSGQIQLPAGGEVTLGSSKRGSATIVIALPGGADPDTIDITDTGVTPPKGSTVTVKPKKESVTIVIALPWPAEGGEPPEIRFSDNGALILPKGTEVTTRNGDQETTTTVTEDAPYLDPETGELMETDLEAPPQPSEPVNPNEPTGETKPVTPETPVVNEKVKVEMDPDTGEIKVTPKDPTDPAKPPVVIKPQPQDPDQPGETPAPPLVDQTGKVFIDTPFKVETEDGPDITAEKGGSVDPDGNVTGETVTVEQKKPDGTTESKTTLTAPEGDAVKVGPDGESKAPVGTEVKQDDVTVKIDDVPDPTKPVTVKPDGTVDLPSGSEITVTPNPQPGRPERPYTVKIDQVPDPEQPVPVKPGGGVDLPGGSQITITPKPDQPGQPEQKYTVTIPADKGGEVKSDPDGKITLPPGAKVKGPDGKETIISSSGGAINPSTGKITGAAPSDVPGGNFPIIDGGGSGSGGSSPASYVIMASASIGGGISPDKQVTVRSGADQTFTIKPDEGYVISDVLVDSESVGAVDSYTFRNVRSGHTIQALFVAEGMSGHGHQGPCPKDETCPIWPYTDSIPTDWYHDGVHYCIENDLMIGTAPVLWEPDIPLSRAMMAQVLYNKAGQPAVGGDGVFSDVDREWYWPAITWGGRSNVLLGYDDGSYGPQNPITREQLATLLWRYAGQPQFDGELSFSDAAQVSDYAKQALNWASRQGVIAGYPDGTFRPQANASRAEAAQMIMRYFEL